MNDSTQAEAILDQKPKSEHKSARSRTATLWISLSLFFVVLLLLTIFILQNSQNVKVSYFGYHGHLALAVAMLFSAVTGALLLALAGGARIIQLRKATKYLPTKSKDQS